MRALPLVIPLLTACLWACGPSPSQSARPRLLEGSGGAHASTPLSASGGQTQASAPEGNPSGTVKSYFDELEQEPPLETESIFANGFTGEIGGLGGAPNPTDFAQLLGIGTGNLTVLALFDRSVSMSDPWDGQPRWQVAGRAFMDGLIGLENQITLGTIFFPQAAECDVAPLSDARQIQFQAGTRFKQHWEAFPQDRFPGGGTPLGPAFERADQAIRQAAEYGLLAAGRRFRVAVITDGKPNCGTDPDRVLFLAAAWRALGVEIYVIGLPGSTEAMTFLNQLAALGGTAVSQAPTDQSEAEETFEVVLR